MKDSYQKTVYVGMSGGVDSSTTAALLKQQGYRVVGVYMKNWTQDLPGFECPWMDDFQDAKRVAVQLGVDFKVYDFETEYKQRVVDYMIDEYRAGRTPNPDIMCNQEIKFKLFLETALSDGADLVATGHYARVQSLSDHVGLPDSASHGLFMAADSNKDQTYFLYRINGSALARTLFPLGDYTKTEVRQLAKKYGLTTANKKESMGICFVGKVGIKDFLSEYVDDIRPGSVIDDSGVVVGKHDGAIFYTIGQRQGLGVGGGLPYYVVGKDMAKNEVYVTTDLDNDRLWSSVLQLSDVHWINGAPKHKTVTVRTRHRAPLIEAELGDFSNRSLRINLKSELRALTPGQSAVIYQDGQCLGGGIII